MTFYLFIDCSLIELIVYSLLKGYALMFLKGSLEIGIYFIFPSILLTMLTMVGISL